MLDNATTTLKNAVKSHCRFDLSEPTGRVISKSISQRRIRVDG